MFSILCCSTKLFMSLGGGLSPGTSLFSIFFGERGSAASARDHSGSHRSTEMFVSTFWMKWSSFFKKM